ncbi:MAG: protein kinase, partial [Pyrinomonadaceae bacterium]|nr:protein kinase [Pyrinomonadaceae bacterium]
MSDQLLGQTVAGKYRIEQLLGADEMGLLYRAHGVTVNKPVLLKVLRPSLAVDPKIVAEFIREATVAAGVWHPHIQNVIDYGEAEDGVVFLAMEEVQGRTLKEIIAAEGALPVPQIIRIFRQACNALEVVHAEGLVHQNLRSDFLKLEAEGAQTQVKVMGFGITEVKETIQPEDSPEALFDLQDAASPEYMSPEQCAGTSEVNARSNIYSLGVILYEMLTGHLPFSGDSPNTIMLKHLEEPPASVLNEREDLPPEIDHVVMRAMAKRPEERYETVGELSRAVIVTAAASGALTATRGLPRAASFDPWRVMIPALALLIVGFSVLYAVQRNRGSITAEDKTTLLKSDPNSLPVQPLAPPSGESERDVAPRPPTTPASVAAPPNSRTNRNDQRGADMFPFPGEGLNTNLNANVPPSTGNIEVLSEAERTRPSPAPTTNTNANRNTNKNTNQQGT